MKLFHTADWHLGKIVQGVYMTEDQQYVLDQFIQAVEDEKPDAVVIAGDLYDRAVPPTEAIYLLNNVLNRLVLELKTPVLAIAGNHDSPSRLNFGTDIMKQHGLHIAGTFTGVPDPVILHDQYGPVHFHLIPYCDPSVVRTALDDDTIQSHDDAAAKIIEHISQKMNPDARHVYVGHAFVTPYGEEEVNTSDSERTLSVGGAEYVNANLFSSFHYTALGHLHHAHHVAHESTRYAGSILKYSISEEDHTKGFSVVDIDASGQISIEKRQLTPERDMRTVEATMEDLLKHTVSYDYVFVALLDKGPVLSPMERIRSVYPNAMHVERKNVDLSAVTSSGKHKADRSHMSDIELFRSFYKEVKGNDPEEETESIFKEVLDDLQQGEHRVPENNN